MTINNDNHAISSTDSMHLDAGNALSNPLLDPLLDALNEMIAQAGFVKKKISLSDEMAQMIAEDSDNQASTSNSSESPKPTQNKNGFFYIKADQEYKLSKLIRIIFKWSEGVKNPNLKAQVLCLLSRADIHFSSYNPNHQSFAPAALLIALETISEEESISVDPINQAHIYSSIAYFLNKKPKSSIAPQLYEAARKPFSQGIFESEERKNCPHNNQTIRNYFEKQATQLAPNLTEIPLHSLLSNTIEHILARPYHNKMSGVYSTPEGTSIRRTIDNKLNRDLSSAKHTFDLPGKNTNINRIIQSSLFETRKLSEHALENDQSPQSAIEWTGITCTILMIARLAQREGHEDDFALLEKTRIEIHKHLDSINPRINTSLRPTLQ